MKKLLISLLFIGSFLNASENRNSTEIKEEKETYEVYANASTNRSKITSKELEKYLIPDVANIVISNDPLLSYEAWCKLCQEFIEAAYENDAEKIDSYI